MFHKEIYIENMENSHSLTINIIKIYYLESRLFVSDLMLSLEHHRSWYIEY